jgi:aspartyl-tRNA(Asn)/glutamyl-tRNA(Gln) amidotransferase subunit C
MHVDAAAVRRIARLARIKVSDAEAVTLKAELSAILDWMRQLDAVDTKNVEPMTRVVAMDPKMRSDEVTDGEIRDAVLQNAPMHERQFFVVPKVVE